MPNEGFFLNRKLKLYFINQYYVNLKFALVIVNLFYLLTINNENFL